MSSQTIYKPKQVSGFHEWLPEYRDIEKQWLTHIGNVFESYGFVNIETPAAEELDVLLSKGEVDKEIYTLARFHADDKDEQSGRLGLRFDQTVPLARYVGQHFNALDFPFKRYQIQKVWRGERPQLGRSREFYQCDIDVINAEHLPLHFDAEMPEVVYQALNALGLGQIQIRISNRKILLGYLEAHGVQNTVQVTRTVDKMEKLGKADILNILRDDIKLSTDLSSGLIDLIETKDLSSVRPENKQMEEGLSELQFVLENLSHLPGHVVSPDLSIVRGLDYYTGTVYETRLLDIPEFTGSICSGGRYDDLAGRFIARNLPGVGISIGFTRLFNVLYHNGYIHPGRKVPTDILIALPSEEDRKQARETAVILRNRGLSVEIFHMPQKMKKQLSYAEKKGIPYVWFLPDGDRTTHEVKNMATKMQSQAAPDTFFPDQKTPDIVISGS